MPHDAADFVIGSSAEQLLANPRTRDAEALLWVPPGDPAVLSAVFPHAPRVRWCHSFFAGVDALRPFVHEHLLPTAGAGTGTKGEPEAKCARGADVVLSNGKGAFSESLAEWVVAAVMHFNKQVPRILRNRIDKKWDKFVMDTVAGKTIGFVGFGHIAQTAARVCRALGMRVLALRRNPEPNALADETLGNDRKLELFERADFVVCVLPGTPATADFCGAAEFSAMKASGVFISIGRGLAVDEEALAAALRNGDIAGAAVDVYKKEPLPSQSPLWACENTLLTSHNADYTVDYFELGWRVWRSNLDGIKLGTGVATPVDKGAGY
eukprot:g2258.t1